MIRAASVRTMFAFGSKVVDVLPPIIFFALSVSMYGTNTLVSGTSSNDDVVRGIIGSLIERARILVASARVIGAFGRKLPSLYPLIHPFFEANVMYSAYHMFEATSGNPDSTQMKL